jgi:hypothetical protein
MRPAVARASRSKKGVELRTLHPSTDQPSRRHDRQSMAKAFDLWSVDDVRAHASAILTRLADGSMPCDCAWPAEQVQVFRRWVDSGMPP